MHHGGSRKDTDVGSQRPFPATTVEEEKDIASNSKLWVGTNLIGNRTTLHRELNYFPSRNGGREKTKTHDLQAGQFPIGNRSTLHFGGLTTLGATTAEKN